LIRLGNKSVQDLPDKIMLTYNRMGGNFIHIPQPNTPNQI